MKNNRRILDIITTPSMLRHRWKLDVRHWSMIGYAEKHVDAVNSPDHFFSYSRIVYIISVDFYAKFSFFRWTPISSTHLSTNCHFNWRCCLPTFCCDFIIHGSKWWIGEQSLLSLKSIVINKSYNRPQTHRCIVRQETHDIYLPTHKNRNCFLFLHILEKYTKQPSNWKGKRIYLAGICLENELR